MKDTSWIRHICENTALYHHRHVLLTSTLSTAINLGRLPFTRIALVPWPQEGGRLRLFRDQVHVGKRHLYDWCNIAQNRLIGSADILNILPEKGESERNWKKLNSCFFPYSPSFLNLRKTLIPANVNTSGPERRSSEVVRQQQRPLELQINPGLAPGSGSLAPTWAESGSRDCTNKVALLQRIPMRFPSKNGIEKGKVHYCPKVWGQ